ncbi:MAG: hypothetical protein JSV44_08940 [Candidatus Zixiibacteriota bacterium]|nr:MAG: hypothetical protein JSV44_08940 [candidate division Zixibacteria bacterium]
MRHLKDKLANLLEYVGLKSTSYYHTLAPISYDPEDMQAYYLDQSRRANYAGPFDDNGVPLYAGKEENVHLPVHIAFWALGHFHLHRRSGDEKHRKAFLRAADWFARDQDDRGAWQSPLAMKRFRLKPPFPSAMSQGLGISCLIRAYRLTRNEPYLTCAVKALRPFHEEIRDGGVTSYHEGRAFYEEYPVYPFKHVLNGFIYSLWGLYDLVRFADNPAARELYDTGVRTLMAWLPRYDLGYWSLYHISDGAKNPATIHYHHLHIDQLTVMHRLTGSEIFGEYRSRWERYLRNPLNGLRTLPAKLRWQFFDG